MCTGRCGQGLACECIRDDCLLQDRAKGLDGLQCFDREERRDERLTARGCQAVAYGLTAPATAQSRG
jgi:hypothetical protein